RYPFASPSAFVPRPGPAGPPEHDTPPPPRPRSGRRDLPPGRALARVSPAPPGSRAVARDLRRSRLLVLFRLPLVIPHLVWLTLWGLLAVLTSILTWIWALVTGYPPRPFHRFLSRFVRYAVHVYAFLCLVGNPFPGFVGKPGTYPVDLELPTPEPQRRLVTGFRALLAPPALL